MNIIHGRGADPRSRSRAESVILRPDQYMSRVEEVGGPFLSGDSWRCRMQRIKTRSQGSSAVDCFIPTPKVSEYAYF